MLSSAPVQNDERESVDMDCGTPRQASLPRFGAGIALVVGLVVASPAAQPVFRGSEIFRPRSTPRDARR